MDYKEQRGLSPPTFATTNKSVRQAVYTHHVQTITHYSNHSPLSSLSEARAHYQSEVVPVNKLNTNLLESEISYHIDPACSLTQKIASVKVPEKTPTDADLSPHFPHSLPIFYATTRVGLRLCMKLDGAPRVAMCIFYGTRTTQ